jgi:hypothetical protein
MREALAANGQKIEELRAQIRLAAARRSESPEARATWQQACAAFPARYDALAFPGGLSAALERLTTANLATAAEVIDYLEIHPYYFRSQYNATRFIRALKKLQLPPDLQLSFEAVQAAARKRRRVPARKVDHD